MTVGNTGCFNNHRRSCLNVGCWNVHYLVEAEGPVTTASTRRGVSVDHKINFLVKELRRFEMSITGVSETKWFGQGVYDVDGFVMVHSGRPVPGDSDLAIRNEGVGIIMSPNAAAAWRKSGENWRAVSSRIVYVTVKLQDSRSRKKLSVSVTSVYAPTYNSVSGKEGHFL